MALRLCTGCNKRKEGRQFVKLGITYRTCNACRLRLSRQEIRKANAKESQQRSRYRQRQWIAYRRHAWQRALTRLKNNHPKEFERLLKIEMKEAPVKLTRAERDSLPPVYQQT